MPVCRPFFWYYIAHRLDAGVGLYHFASRPSRLVSTPFLPLSSFRFRAFSLFRVSYCCTTEAGDFSLCHLLAFYPELLPQTAHTHSLSLSLSYYPLVLVLLPAKLPACP